MKAEKLYLAIEIHAQYQQPAFVARKKKTIVEHLKQMGYYWSEASNRYINYKNRTDKYGSREPVFDYKIEMVTNLDAEPTGTHLIGDRFKKISPEKYRQARDTIRTTK